MAKYVTEFIGTFFLVLAIGMTAITGTPLAPIAIGSTLMVMVYMGGHISGGHYNPAVSLGVWLRGKLSATDFVAYFLVQVLGALVAALTMFWITGRTFAPAPGAAPLVPPMKALVVEALYAFALVLVVLNVATAKKTEGNSFYGLAIGFTIVIGAIAVGPISGGAFNPAVGIGLTGVNAIIGGGTWAHLWLYIVGPLAGGAAAAGVFKIQGQE